MNAANAPNNDGPLEWFQSLPPLTRAWFGASLALTAAVTLDLVPASKLLFDWDRIYNDLELWRLATCFCFGGGSLREFPTLILLYLILNFSRSYERNPLDAGAGGSAADAAFAGLFCSATILVTYPLLLHYGPRVFPAASPHGGPFLFPVFTRTLAYSIMYLWAKKNPDVRADVNFIPMTGKYLPFAHLGISLCMGQRINETAHGLAVGHLFYYLVVVVPAVRGRGQSSLVRTPQFLVDWFDGGLAGGEDVVWVGGGDGADDDDDDDDVGLPPMPPVERPR